jgi:4-hydroxy-tetrahydrodipicolinate synthase
MTTWRGILPIIVTPFHEDKRLDEEGLAAIVEFNIAAGAHGVVGPAVASEFTTLSDDEKRRWIEVVALAAKDLIPFVATVTSGHAIPAADLGRYAQEMGAAGVMAMPPPAQQLSGEGCYKFFQHLSESLDIPVCVQNFMGPIGTPMGPELLRRMCSELEQVRYIKEETIPEPRKIRDTIEAAGESCSGVFGGNGGLWLIDEYVRGSAGNMPACHTTDIVVRIWDQLEKGDVPAARELFNRLLPLINFERLMSMAVYKEILRRRGIIRTGAVRGAIPELDEHDLNELDALYALVEPLFTI